LYVGVFEEFFSGFDAVEYFDEAGGVVMEGAFYDAVFAQFLKPRQLFISQGCAAVIGNVESGKRTNAVCAVWITHCFEVGKLHVRPRLHRFTDEIRVFCGVNAFGGYFTIGSIMQMVPS
jgi:hypothetical protein